MTKSHDVRVSDSHRGDSGDGAAGETTALTGTPLHVEQASVLATTLNTLCNVVGAGVLSLPFAIHNSSIITGLILIVVTGIAGAFAAYVLVCGSEFTGKFSEAEVIAFSVFPPLPDGTPKVDQDRRSWRRKGLRTLVTSMIVALLWGVMIVYAKVIAESVPPVIRGFFGYKEGIFQTEVFWLVVPGVIFFGLTCLRKLSELKWTSLLGFATILYCILTVVSRYFTNFEHKVPGSGGPVIWFQVNISLFTTITTLSAAYNYHFNVNPFYRELKDRTPVRMMKSVAISVPIIGVCYAVTGVLGYLLFGPAVAGKHAGNILSQFPDDDVAVNIGRFLLFFHFVCVFPILSITCRRGVHDLLLHIPHDGLRVALTGAASAEEAAALVPREGDEHERGAGGDIDADHVFTTPMYINVIEAFILVGVAVLGAAFVHGIGVLIEIFGALFGVFVMLVGPGMIGVSIWNRQEHFRVWVGSVVLLCFGIVCWVIGVVSIGLQFAGIQF